MFARAFSASALACCMLCLNASDHSASSINWRNFCICPTGVSTDSFLLGVKAAEACSALLLISASVLFAGAPVVACAPVPCAPVVACAPVPCAPVPCAPVIAVILYFSSMSFKPGLFSEPGLSLTYCAKAFRVYFPILPSAPYGPSNCLYFGSIPDKIS